MVAHDEEKVQSTPPHADVCVLQVGEYCCFMLFYRPVALHLCQPRHGLQPDVPNVWLPNRDEAAEERQGLLS